MAEARAELRALALFNRAVAKDEKGDLEGSISDLTGVIEMVDPFPEN